MLELSKFDFIPSATMELKERRKLWPAYAASFGAVILAIFVTVQSSISSENLTSKLSEREASCFESDPASVARQKCKLTCSLEVVESIPDNVSFSGFDLPRSTFDAWRTLIRSAKHDIEIAAYKSSLRGKHVLGDSTAESLPGEEIFDSLVNAGRDRGVAIRMVENFPPKDDGDNADGDGLVRRDAVERRSLHFTKVFGSGTMHSKFLVVDKRHLYLGSANLDWRSLNQKMELGVLMLNCPCLAKDLRNVFHSYWDLTDKQEDDDAMDTVEAMPTHYNRVNPLTIEHKGVPTHVYLATSPKELNGEGRTWDLEAILAAINGARHKIYIHVMDYIPMIVYREPKKYWPVIDDALRQAIVERDVEVKVLAAALHFAPMNLRFLKSLQSIDGVNPKSSIEVKIFKVPAVTEVQSVIARERRTHNKFLVTEKTAIIGTSNWSGDYFEGNTGVALVVRQNETANRPFIEEMQDIFMRDWNSDYAHSLRTYMSLCMHRKNEDELCETEKNSSTLMNNKD